MKLQLLQFLFFLFSVLEIKVTQSLVVSQCDSDEECKAIELCEYESQIAYEKRFGELKFCGVYLKDTLHCCKLNHAGFELPENVIRIDTNNESSPVKDPSQVESSKVNSFESHKNFRLINDATFCGKTFASGDSQTVASAASFNQFPWVALLQYKSTSDDYDDYELSFRCAGTLISLQYVLTAASCRKKENSKLYSVRLGEHTISKDPDCVETSGLAYCNPPHEDILIETFTPHEDYNPETKRNDIALIRLSRPVVLSRRNFNIKTICLPVKVSQEVDFFDDLIPKLSTTGWGQSGVGEQSDVLKYAELSYLTNEECSDALKELKKTFKLTKTVVEETELCATGVNPVDLCRGDIGSPLTALAELYSKNNRVFLHGLVSNADACKASTIYPGVFTRVSTYMPWIMDNISP